MEKGTRGGRRRQDLPWRRGGVAARDSVPSSGTSGVAGLGLGLARLAGPAQFGGGRERRERAVLGFGLALFEEFFLNKKKFTDNKNNKNKGKLKYYIDI